MTSRIHARLSSSLKDIGNHNVIIQVGNNTGVKEFPAHSSVLRACSPYFESVLPTLTAEKNSLSLLLKLPNINPTIFELIHKYIYSNELDLTELSRLEILSLLDASDELHFKRLINHVQVHLIKQQSDWIQQNIALVIHKAFKIANCKLLQDHCIEIICENPSSFITSTDFLLLDKDILHGSIQKSIILSPRFGKLQMKSKIIKPRHIPKIINWIQGHDDKISENDEKDYLFTVKYAFNLLPESDSISDILDHKSTLMLVKDRNSSKIYGGYKSYESNNSDLALFNDKCNCFIFCFENNEDTRDVKMTRINYNYLDRRLNFSFKDYYGSVIKIIGLDPLEVEAFEVKKIVKGLE
ncbi:16877_t:CDS:2 [Funneliformis geosporum]|nr:16877_t:CDS:2 [Funneliformis geosporum]